MKHVVAVLALLAALAAAVIVRGDAAAYSFPERWNTGVPIAPSSFADSRRVADFDGDGRPEIAELLPGTSPSRMTLVIVDAAGQRRYAGPGLVYNTSFEVALADVDQNGTLDYVMRGPVISGGSANFAVYGFTDGFQLLDSLTTPDPATSTTDWFYANLETDPGLELVVIQQSNVLVEGAYAGTPLRVVRLHPFGTAGYSTSFTPGGISTGSALTAEAHDLNQNGLDELYVSYAGRIWMYSSESAVAAVPPAATGARPLSMGAPWPNPSSGDTNLRFRLTYGAAPVLRVHDAAGRNVRQVTLPLLPAGEHEYRWDGKLEDGRHAAPGMYWLELDAGGATTSRRVVRLR